MGNYFEDDLKLLENNKENYISKLLRSSRIFDFDFKEIFGIFLKEKVPAPQTHKKSVRVTLTLFIFMIVISFLMFSSYVGFGFELRNSSYINLFCCLVLVALPAVYTGFLELCAWLDVDGYSWDDVPHFE